MRILPKSPLAIGAALFVFLSVCFAVDAYFANAKDGPNLFDLSCANALKEFSQEHLGLAWLVVAITFLGSIYVLGPLALVGVLWQLGSGNRWLAVAWFCIVLIGAGLNDCLKSSFERDRPKRMGLLDPVVSEKLEDYSFPSGHSMGCTIGYGLVAYFLAVRPKRRTNWAFRLTMTLLALLIGASCFSRVYLRAHWATDVIGGFLMGAAWLALTLSITETWRRRLASRAP